MILSANIEKDNVCDSLLRDKIRSIGLSGDNVDTIRQVDTSACLISELIIRDPSPRISLREYPSFLCARDTFNLCLPGFKKKS